MTSSEVQIPMFSPDDTRVLEESWLGLVTDHRRLFDALQDGWLRPLPQHSGILVGIEGYVAESDRAKEGHPIEVHLKIDPEKLPDLEAPTFCSGQWETRSIREVRPPDTTLYWPGVLPTFSILEISVSSEEERARLTGLAQFASNLILPEDVVRANAGPEDVLSADTRPREVAPRLVVPSVENALHGAISMAVWAVPRIDPWLDLLMTSLSSDRTRLPELANSVDAPWWRFPPWVPIQKDMEPASPQDCLWRAAVDTFSSALIEDGVAPRELAVQVADAASRYGETACTDSISSWREATHSILRGEAVFLLDDPQTCPVGKAVQLVLTRPDPIRFKTWFQDLPELPPGIGWSAAALCGLLHGYRRLDAHFRGEAFQRELLSVLALRACADEARELDWPSLASGDPRWRKDSGSVVLSWGGVDFARRPQRPRGRWYAANLEDAQIAREAKAVAKALGWTCTNREIVLKDARLPLRGLGTVHTVFEPSARLEVKGEVRLRMQGGVTIEEALDAEAFRHMVAVEGGRFSDPPIQQFRDLNVQELDVPGLTYARYFVTATEEEELVARIDRGDWRSDIKRRVQHYGWRYDYKARRVEPSMYLGPLPDWADDLAQRLFGSGLVPQLPDQVIVNEYVANQGIGPHTDAASFADGIATISLLESWDMVFREKSTKRKVGQALERRSVAVVTGDARYRWTHEIPSRKIEPGRGTRGRRISLTFRKVISPSGGKHKSK